MQHNDYSLTHYHYDYPRSLVANAPAEPREAARLMVARGGDFTHHTVADLPALLPPGTLLVLNDARVFPARLRLHRQTGAQVEVLLLQAPDEGGQAQALLRPARKVQPGEILFCDAEPALLVLVKDAEKGTARVKLLAPRPMPWLHEHATVPLPPYMADNPDLYSRYQTVFAKHDNAVAAPTAGLHFGEALLAALEAAGHELAHVTLAVGYGTFAPLKHEDIRQHQMHEEWCCLSAQTAGALNEARARRRPVLAVGTTALRVLETCFDGARFSPGAQNTGIYLHPGNRPRTGVSLLTNFHLPGTSLLVLLASLLPQWRDAYEEAIRQRYRLFSFGDTMLVWRFDGTQ